METEVYIGGIRVFVDETGENTKVKIESALKKEIRTPLSGPSHSILDVNKLLEMQMGIPSSDNPYAVKGWGSWNVGSNWMAAQRTLKASIGLRIAIPISINFKFGKHVIPGLSEGDNQIEFAQRNDVEDSRGKISASYVTAMTMLGN